MASRLARAVRPLPSFFEGRLFSAAEHVERGKPHPDIYLHAALELGVAPAEVLVLEDTPTGVKSAVAAGMTVVGLCAGLHCGPGHGEKLSAAGAHHVADSYDDVLKLVMPDLIRHP